MNLKKYCNSVTTKNRFYSIYRFDVVTLFVNFIFDFTKDGKECFNTSSTRLQQDECLLGSRVSFM